MKEIQFGINKPFVAAVDLCKSMPVWADYSNQEDMESSEDEHKDFNLKAIKSLAKAMGAQPRTSVYLLRCFANCIHVMSLH